LAFNFQREYEAHVILGDPSSAPLWQGDRWATVFAALQPLSKQARGVAVTHSTQFTSPGNEAVSFGRIGWNPAGHSKWTHASETPHRFLMTEVWAPSRGLCQTDRCPPDFLFVLWNQEFFSTECTFRDVVVLAVPSANAVAVAACVSAAGRLAALTQAKFHGRMTRPWGRSIGNGGFTDCLGDMPTTALFRAGPVFKQTPGNEILLDPWEPVPATAHQAGV